MFDLRLFEYIRITYFLFSSSFHLELRCNGHTSRTIFFLRVLILYRPQYIAYSPLFPCKLLHNYLYTQMPRRKMYGRNRRDPAHSDAFHWNAQETHRKMEAVFQPEFSRIFSNDFRPFPTGKHRELAGIHRKKVPAGILLPLPVLSCGIR